MYFLTLNTELEAGVILYDFTLEDCCSSFTNYRIRNLILRTRSRSVGQIHCSYYAC